MLMVGVLLSSGCSTAPPAPTQIATEPVTLEIQSGTKKESVLIEGLPLGCTVEDVMRSAQQQGLDIEMSGSGTTAFISAINGESGSGTQGWLFKVDGEYSDRGIGTTELDPPATITWVFDDMSAALAK